MSNALILQCHWSFEQIANSAMSDVIEFIKSDELNQYHKLEGEKFKALLKTIASVAGR